MNARAIALFILVVFAASLQTDTSHSSVGGLPELVGAAPMKPSTGVQAAGLECLSFFSDAGTTLFRSTFRSKHLESFLLFLFGAILFSVSTVIRFVRGRRRKELRSGLRRDDPFFE
jgi:hypothetical protein